MNEDCERCQFLSDYIMEILLVLDRHQQEIAGKIEREGPHSGNRDIFQGRTWQLMAMIKDIGDIPKILHQKEVVQQFYNPDMENETEN